MFLFLPWPGNQFPTLPLCQDSVDIVSTTPDWDRRRLLQCCSATMSASGVITHNTDNKDLLFSTRLLDDLEVSIPAGFRVRPLARDDNDRGFLEVRGHYLQSIHYLSTIYLLYIYCLSNIYLLSIYFRQIFSHYLSSLLSKTSIYIKHWRTGEGAMLCSMHWNWNWPLMVLGLIYGRSDLGYKFCHKLWIAPIFWW